METLIQLGIVLYALAAAVSAWRRQARRPPVGGGMDLATRRPQEREAWLTGPAPTADPAEGESGGEGAMGDEGVLDPARAPVAPEALRAAAQAAAGPGPGRAGGPPRTPAEWRRAFLGALLWGPPVARSRRPVANSSGCPFGAERPIAYRPQRRS